MDLLSGLPTNVRKNIMERSKGMLISDEPCEEHPRYMKMIMPDGNLLCPVCYREKRDQEVQQERSKKYYENTAVGRREFLYKNSIVSNKNILHKGLKDFYARSDRERAIQKQVKLLVNDVASSDPINIYFQGVPGSGKSHLAMALMQNANSLANGKRFLFVNFPALQQRIRKSYNSEFSVEGEADFIQKMIDCDVLTLDDIASEINPLTMQGKISEFSSRILYSVMVGRAEKKPTIITSNISWKDLQQLLDPRVVSRFSYRLTLISFDGVMDKRKDKSITEKKENRTNE